MSVAVPDDTGRTDPAAAAAAANTTPVAPGVEATSTTQLPPITTTTSFSKPQPPERGVALAWSPNRLPEGIADAVAAVSGVEQVIRVDAATLYATDVLDTAGQRRSVPEPGWLVPLETFAVAPASAPAGLERLADGVGYLSRSSAELRDIGVGGVLRLDGGSEISIVGIVDDAVLGAPELIVSTNTASQLGDFEPRFLLFEFEGLSGSVERDVRSAFPPDVPVRFRGPGETSYFRHADAVLPQVIVKKVFGEFTVNSTHADPFEVDPEWFEANIITEQLPLVGTVTCHRSLMPLLSEALTALSLDRPGVVDSSGFEGCWNPRFVAGSHTISRHAWGIAVDINHPTNPTGSGAAMDPAVVDALAGLGFTWGGDWLIPDPAHFEWVGR